MYFRYHHNDTAAGCCALHLSLDQSTEQERLPECLLLSWRLSELTSTETMRLIRGGEVCVSVCVCARARERERERDCVCVCGWGGGGRGRWPGRVEMNSSSTGSDTHRPQMGAGRINTKITYSTSGQS